MERWVRDKVRVTGPHPGRVPGPCLPTHLMIYLASIQRAPCQGPTTQTRQSSPPTCSCCPSCDQRDLPQVSSLQPVTSPFPATLALASSPRPFGKGQAGSSHGGALSLSPLPTPGGCTGLRTPCPHPQCSHPCPYRPDLCLHLQSQLLLSCHFLLLSPAG